MGNINRRTALAALGLVTGNAGLASTLRAAAPPPAPWVYHPLDPGETARRAYRHHADNGCMFAVCHSILEQLAEAHGAPYDSFPSRMLGYGHGGVGGHGSLCGAANGGACAIGLFHSDKAKRDGLIGALLTWYELADLPAYRPDPTDTRPFARSVAHSVLCHVSVARWCRQAKAEPDGPGRSERCRRLSADVGAKTVELLNRAAAGAFAAPKPAPATGACLACHQKPGKGQRTVKTRMHCATCHKPDLDHPD